MIADSEMQSAGIPQMQAAQFSIRSPHDVTTLAQLLSQMFPNPNAVKVGLMEIFMNAVEHGIAEIGYATKTRLVTEDRWHEELERRLALPENRDKFATIHFRRAEDGYYITVKDPGPGFAWKNYLAYDPARASDYHGRGIAQAIACSFDRLTYNEKGNEAMAFIGQKPR